MPAPTTPPATTTSPFSMPTPPSSISRSPAIPRWRSSKFTALGNRDHWWTDPDGYKDGKGRFTYELGAFAKAEDDMGSAMPFGDAVLATPGFLLPLPGDRARGDAALPLQFPAGGSVVTALRPDQDGYYQVPLLRLNEVGPLILGTVAAQADPGRSGADARGSARRDCRLRTSSWPPGSRRSRKAIAASGRARPPRAASSSSSRARAAACRSGACCRSAARW